MADGGTMGPGPWASLNVVNSVEKARAPTGSVRVKTNTQLPRVCV